MFQHQAGRFGRWAGVAMAAAVAAGCAGLPPVFGLPGAGAVAIQASPPPADVVAVDGCQTEEELIYAGAHLGAYEAQRIPAGWKDLAREEQVTAGIAWLESKGDWSCVQILMPGATAVYQTLKRKGAASPVPEPTPLPRASTEPLPAPRPTPSPTPAPADDCAALGFSPESAKGRAKHGAFQGVPLPASWMDADDQATILLAIDSMAREEATWPCFVEQFPEAAKTYSVIVKAIAAAPTATPSSPPNVSCDLIRRVQSGERDALSRRQGSERAMLRAEVAASGMAAGGQGAAMLEALAKKHAAEHAALSDRHAADLQSSGCPERQ